MYVDNTVSKGSQLLEKESYSFHIGSSFLFCAGLAYVADVPYDHPTCLKLNCLKSPHLRGSFGASYIC